jgi:hypothetical protein
MKFQVRSPSGQAIVAAMDDNVDVLIDLEDGRSYAATFFTTRNLETLMARYRESGECANGAYVWASDMIVVAELSQAVIDTAVADLIATGEIESCCARLR